MLMHAPDNPNNIWWLVQTYVTCTHMYVYKQVNMPAGSITMCCLYSPSRESMGAASQRTMWNMWLMPCSCFSRMVLHCCNFPSTQSALLLFSVSVLARRANASCCCNARWLFKSRWSSIFLRSPHVCSWSDSTYTKQPAITLHHTYSILIHSSHIKPQLQPVIPLHSTYKKP
jgi:hypothetical protein